MTDPTSGSKLDPDERQALLDAYERRTYMGDMADYAREQEDRARLVRERDARMAKADEDALNNARPLTPHAHYHGLMMKDSPVAVVGIPYTNPNGSKRMDTIERMAIGQLVKLVREPDNKFDPNAVAVYAAIIVTWPDNIQHTDSDQIGYLPRGLAAYYQPLMDEEAGDPLQVFGILAEKRYNDAGRMTHLLITLGLLEEKVKTADVASSMAPTLGSAL